MNSNKTVKFFTLGCKVNQYETEQLSNTLRELGVNVISGDGVADIYVVNSCSVTATADKKTRNFVRRAKRENEKAKVFLIGCIVNVNKNIKDDLPQVDVFLSAKDKNKLIEHFTKKNVKMDYAYSYSGRSKAYIKIQDGCENFCAYCIVPYARGKERSRQENEILNEIEDVLKRGFKEIVLTGINIARYKDKNADLLELCEKISKLDYDFKITLSSLEPNVCGIDDYERLIKIHKINRQFHISLQSGSDDVLKNMKRKYTSKDYLSIVKLLRDFDKNFVITTDVIVGFPGESEKDFEDTVRIIKKCKFDKLHVFRYSDREGTLSSKMENKVPEQVKKKRAEKLMALSGK